MLTAAMSPGRAAWWRHLGPVANLVYYLYLGYVVVRSGVTAWRGRLDDASWAFQSHSLLWRLEWLGARFHITGLEHLRACQGGAVLVANHMSALETVVLPGQVLPFLPCVFVVKEALLRYPFFGRILRATVSIAITRKNPRADLEKVLEEGPLLLQQGRAIILFPQGTRSQQFTPASCGSLGAKLARRAGVPLVPVALRTDMWGIGWPVKDIGWLRADREVWIEFGPPLPVTGNGRAEHQASMAWIAQKLLGWGVTVHAAEAANEAG